MANHSSAKKMISVIARRTEVNKARRSKMRTCIKKALMAIQAGDKSIALASFRYAEAILQSSVNKGIIHKNTAARYKSRLNARVKKLFMAAQG